MAALRRVAGTGSSVVAYGDTGSALTDLNYATRPDGQHAEWFWRREFPAAYEWLFPAADGE